MLDCDYVVLVSLFLIADVCFSSLPFFGDFHEYRGDESQDRVCIWKKSCDSCSAFDLSVQRLAGVGGSQSFPFMLRQAEDLESFGDGSLHPVAEIRCAFAVFLDEGFEFGFGMFERVGIEDRAYVGGDGFAHV